MLKLMRRNNKKGFTLVELIVVIAILAILALILVPAITSYVGKATDAKNEASAKALYNKALLLATDEGADKDYIEEGLADDLGADDEVVVNMDDAGVVVESITYTPKGGTAITIPTP